MRPSIVWSLANSLAKLTSPIIRIPPQSSEARKGIQIHQTSRSRARPKNTTTRLALANAANCSLKAHDSIAPHLCNASTHRLSILLLRLRIRTIPSILPTRRLARAATESTSTTRAINFSPRHNQLWIQHPPIAASRNLTISPSCESIAKLSQK
ncbi:hypothetical protein VTK26DRAFT_5514 [Humicola hyalothermophila]